VRVKAPTETLLYVVRHGEVDPSWRDRVYGCLDVPLSAHGEAEARASAAALAGVELDAVFTSPLARARFTAQLLAEQRRAGAIEHRGLCELDRGAWAGMSFSELESMDPGALARWNRAPDRVRPPNGESLADLHARVVAALRELIGDRAPRAVAVAAHGWVARVIVCDALGLPLAAAARLRMRTGCVAAVHWNGERPARLLGHDIDRAVS
jgi:broad specificity phosphatase PhoE